MQRNFLEIFSRPEDTRWAKEVPEGALRGAQPTRARLGPQARPGGLCPLGAPLWYFFGPSCVFWPRKILQKVLLRLDSV